MNKLLVICGPTATGKTKLAGFLAKKFNGELVSADSRQVFVGMDIGTGKDYVEGVKIWGYDLVSPQTDFSVSKYLNYTSRVIADIQKRGKLPIVVGGTGLYIKGIVDGIPTVIVPRNDNLREKLEIKSASELLESLSQLDSIKVGSLNSSDRKNPRRLVRAIEIAQWKLEHGRFEEKGTKPSFSVLSIGLAASEEVLFENIENRVGKRIEDGIKKEIEDLLKKGVGWDDQSMLSLGYRQWRDFFEGGVEEDVVISEWKKEERKYAKRQMTWFKKEKDINWFDITSKEYPENVEKLMSVWHNTK